jgi:hypothetical protein
MDAIHLTHVQLAKAEPGSLVLVGSTDAEAQQYFAIAVHRAGEPFLTRLVSFRADRGALRATRVELSATEAPDRFVLSLGRHFTIEPNLFEQVRTDVREGSALKAGDLLVVDTQQFLVVTQDKLPLVVDLAGGEVTELAAASVAVVTHWSICVRNAAGERICLVDTKSHKQAAPSTSGFALRAHG